MVGQTTDGLTAGIRKEVQDRLLDGFENDRQIAQSAAFAVSDLHAIDATRRRLIARITAEMAAEHRLAQAAWPTPTDCDRLDAAFADLKSRGIVARQHFELDEGGGKHALDRVLARSQGRIKGYTFLTWQDTAGARECGALWLPYSSGQEGSDEADAWVAGQIVDALRQVGLSPEWDGDPRKYIRVPLAWRRRRPERMKRHRLHADYR